MLFCTFQNANPCFVFSLFSVDHLCQTPNQVKNSKINLDDVYSVFPSGSGATPGDRFWFFNSGGFEMSTNILSTPAGPWVNDITHPTGTFSVPYNIWLQTKFSDDRTFMLPNKSIILMETLQQAAVLGTVGSLIRD